MKKAAVKTTTVYTIILSKPRCDRYHFVKLLFISRVKSARAFGFAYEIEKKS